MDKLRDLYNNKVMLAAWEQFTNEITDDYILSRVYLGKDVAAAPEVRKIIKKCFSELEKRYKPQEKHGKTDRAV